MFDSRKNGLTHCYYDIGLDRFSNVSLGLISRCLGANYKIAYFNSKKNSFPLVDFFYKFYLKNLDFISYDSFGINYVKNYDLIIFDNFDFNVIKKETLLNLLSNKSEKTEFVLILKDKKEYLEIKDYFDLVSEYIYTVNKSNSKKSTKIDSNEKNLGEIIEPKENITILSGKGKGKSTFSFGFAIRNLIDKKYVKLVYYDKGGDFYSEMKFFDKMKYVKKRFTYYQFGEKRFEGKSFRFENNKNDILEAEFALNELKRSYEDQVFIADELNTLIGSKLISEDKIFEILNSIENPILITGRCDSKKILNLSKYKIEVKEIKHYMKKGEKVRFGIDY